MIPLTLFHILSKCSHVVVVCGNRLPPSKELDDECNMACPGDSTKNCGAGSRLTLFTGGPGTSGPEYEIEGWSYIGCIE